MNKNLLITLLLFGSIEVTSQANSDDTLLICENSRNLWIGVSLNVDAEQISYLEFGANWIKPTRNWKKADYTAFNLKTIRLARQQNWDVWTLYINRESLDADLEMFYKNAISAQRSEMQCSIVEDKDLFQSKVDDEIRKYELAQQQALQRKKEAEEKARLAKEAQKKKNKI